MVYDSYDAYDSYVPCHCSHGCEPKAVFKLKDGRRGVRVHRLESSPMDSINTARKPATAVGFAAREEIPVKRPGVVGIGVHIGSTIARAVYIGMRSSIARAVYTGTLYRCTPGCCV